jgi:hypothetical protein
MGENDHMHHQPTGAAFDIVLLLHVVCVFVGLATVVTSAATASRLKRVMGTDAVLPETVARYFRPGINWAGRTMWGIPILGFALLAMSRGAYDLHDTWVSAGLGLFVLLILVAEGMLWPAERRLQGTLLPYVPGVTATDRAVQRDRRTMALSSGVVIVLLLAGSAIMLAQP